jgi:hypothetical protein
MADIFYFKPQAELDAESNLKGFIDLCRNKLTVFGSDLSFDENVWDITSYIALKGERKKRIRLIFSMLLEPFLCFAKSYMRYMHGVHQILGYQKRLNALIAVNNALSENGGCPDPVRIDALILNRAAQMLSEKYKDNNAYITGLHLKMLAEFLTENRLTTIPVRWRNFLKQPPHATSRVGKEFDERRQSKLPSEAALEALPKVFLLATEPVDVIVASVAAILCSSPNRISEVLILPANCEVYQKRGSDKDDAYGLRWWPAKGADPMVKWIVPAMSSVIKEAISKIRTVTGEARRIAKWHEDNPGCIYLSADLEYLRGKEWLSLAEVKKVIGLSQGCNIWCSTHKLKKNTSNCVRFADVQNAVLDMLPKGFPVLDPETGLKYSEALFICRTHELGIKTATYNCMIEPIDGNQISAGLGSLIASRHPYPSIFSRFGFTEPDGSPIKITTHQFRHYLNTLAQMGGMSQLDIAKWSGRKDIRQNAAYDHVTADQMLIKIRGAIGDESQFFGPLAEIPKRVLIPRDEFARLMVPTAHTTDFGFCIHDYTMSPCRICMDCIHCEKLICVKGDEEKTKRLKRNLEESFDLMKRAENAVGDGYAGSDRWLEHHRSAVARLSQLCSIMDSPDVPVGSMIQLASPKSARRLNEPIKLPNAQDSAIISRVMAEGFKITGD